MATATWYGHVITREEEYVGKRMMALQVYGGQEKRKTEVEMDGQHHGIPDAEGIDENRDRWKRLTRQVDPTEGGRR